MFKPSFRALVCLATLLLLAACGQEYTSPSSTATAVADPVAQITEAPVQKPNILLITADDLGWSDLGVYGGEIPTPNLDELARGGMLLSQFYAGMTCSPTRSMIMSGMDNHRAGLGAMGAREGVDGYEAYLNFRVASLAELMTDAGYNTYMSGKWHLGNTDTTNPVARGFKHAFASFDGAGHLGPWGWTGPTDANYWDDTEVVHVGEDFYSTREYITRMIGYIDADKEEGKPFFGWLAPTAPHWPLQAPAESIARFEGQYDEGYEAIYLQRFNRQKELGLIPENVEPIPMDRFSPRWDELSDGDRAIQVRYMEIYAAMVSDLDRYIGEVVDYLKEIGEYENTLIVFTSDNGTQANDLSGIVADYIGTAYDNSLDNLGSATSYISYGTNWASATQTPLNRHKATGFEGGIRVPAFAHYPKGVPAGSSSHELLHVMDLLPTFVDLAGAELPEGTYRGREINPVQGTSFLPLILGETDSMRSDSEVVGWELHGHRALRQGSWKLVWDQAERPTEARHWRLFNLDSDPFEQQDLSEERPEKFQEMLANWEAYVRDSGVMTN